MSYFSYFAPVANIIATQLKITTQPSSVMAGNTTTLIAEAQDDANQKVVSWPGTSTLSITDGTPSVRTVADFEADNSEYLNGGDQPDFEFDNDFTLFAWWKIESKTTVRTVFSKWIASGNNREYILYYDNSADRIRFGQSHNGNNNTLLSNNQLGSPTIGTWYFTVCKHEDGVGLTIETNRGTPDSAAQVNGQAKTSAAFQAGAGDALGSLLWDGNIGLVGMAPSLLSDTILDDLYNNGIVPFVTELDDATIAACKQTGGDNGDLLFMLDEASGNRISYSGNYTLTDTNTVTSTSSGETVTYLDVVIESGSTASSVGGVLTFNPEIGRPGTNYRLTVSDDAEILTSAQSNTFEIS